MADKVVVESQAHFLPRLHHIKRMVDADVFVLMNSHQLGPHWQSRTVIKTTRGVQYLAVPVKGGQRQNISDVRIDSQQPWQRKLLETLRHAYMKAPYYQNLVEGLEGAIYDFDSSLFQLNYTLLNWIVDPLAIETPIVHQSSLGQFTQRKTELMVAITRAAGGMVYHCGEGAVKEFYEVSKFEEAGIELRTQNWDCPAYPQLWGEFVPCLSVIDALFNIGVFGTREILGIEK